MKHKSLKQAVDREWIQPVKNGYLMGCCDCGLVHRMDFRIVSREKNGKTERKVQFRASRARNYTSRLRKKEGIRVRK